MRSTRRMVAFAVGIFTLTSNFALAQGHGNGQVTKNMEMVTTRTSATTRITTATLCANGMTNTRATFRPDLPSEISCPLDWKNNLCGAARSRLGSRNGCNPVLKTLSGGYPRHLPIARTF